MLINMVLPGAVETARLPKEYQEVEYIQSSGTQYIDTGFKPNQDTRVVCDLQQLQSTNTWRCFFGSRIKSGSDATFAVWLTDASVFRTLYGNPPVSIDFSASVSAVSRQTIDANKNTTTIGGEAVSFSLQTFQCAHSLYLFASNSNGVAEFFSSSKLYSCQIYDNGTLIRNFVPCYRKADNAVGLYDLVNDAFYTNAGTGTFIKGADVGGSGSSGEPFAFTYSGNYTDNRVDDVGTVRLNTSGTLTVTSGKATVSVYILGAGSGGVNNTSAGSNGRKGGGGGGYQTVEVTLEPGTYEIVIGTGGKAAQGYTDPIRAGNGGNTTAFGYTSTGAIGAYCYTDGSGSVGVGGTPNGNNGSGATGGSPNGGLAPDGTEPTTTHHGGDGYVELTFI